MGRRVSGRHEPEEEFNHLDGLLTIDTDGWLFLDYLRAGEAEFDGAINYLGFLARHRRLIVQGLAEAGGDVRVLAKYEWMRRYHDARVALMIAELRDGRRPDGTDLLGYSCRGRLDRQPSGLGGCGLKRSLRTRRKVQTLAFSAPRFKRA